MRAKVDGVGTGFGVADEGLLMWLGRRDVHWTMSEGGAKGYLPVLPIVARFCSKSEHGWYERLGLKDSMRR